MIADTDVLIDHLLGVEPIASQIQRARETGDLRTTVITRFELLRGAARARRAEALRSLLADIEALPLTVEAADLAAAICRDLERIGATIDRADCLISGIALANDEPLLTRNLRHFSRVGALRLVPLAESTVHEP